MHRNLASLALLCESLFWLVAGVAHASTFDVSPISLTLSEKAPSGMLTVTNRGSAPLRFQVSVFTWDQKPDGDMVLNPTTDIVFFPAMLTLNANEKRNLRVGVQVKPGAREKSYRIFVQELPPLQTNPDEQGIVRVLTKMGIPIFVEPPAARPVAALGGLSLHGVTFTFDVKNPGNAHFRSEKVLVSAKDAAGKLLDSHAVDGWYVLAGGTRTYVLELPKKACEGLKSLQVDLESDKGATAKATLADAHCAP